VQDIVEGVVGPGAARVQVTAELDLNRITQESETFDPEGRVVRSTETTEDNTNSNEGGASAGASASRNLPDAGGSGGAGGSNSSGSTSTKARNRSGSAVCAMIRAAAPIEWPTPIPPGSVTSSTCSPNADHAIGGEILGPRPCPG